MRFKEKNLLEMKQGNSLTSWRETYSDEGKLKVGELSLNIDYGIFPAFRKRIPKDKNGRKENHPYLIRAIQYHP
ncbi:hypothetical protein [Pyrococcus yayanosii]|uniref:hypothetical protein n=1 Tax=Pyrococcus yayanosii TaxID=1008460 RepID=UPI0011D201F2|nr:hypothetical protein [Pyrococcus yayanosii]